MDYETLNESEWERVGQVWAALDEGEIERSRIELKALLKSRPGHPDLRILDAAIGLEEGDARRALEVLHGAERSADPALFFHLRALAHFDLCRFDDARADAERALAIRADLAETHDVLSRTLEFLGDDTTALDHAEMAEELDSERYPQPLEMSDEEFDRLVEKSVAELPEPVRKHLGDLPVLVEPLPKPEILLDGDPPLAPDVLGLFVGQDLMNRTVADPPRAPGAIYLFRRNLLRLCHDREELENEVRITVQHEVGHLLGLDEDDLEQWGLA